MSSLETLNCKPTNQTSPTDGATQGEIEMAYKQRCYICGKDAVFNGTVAFPKSSSGTYGFCSDKCADVMVSGREGRELISKTTIEPFSLMEEWLNQGGR